MGGPECPRACHSLPLDFFFSSGFQLNSGVPNPGWGQDEENVFSSRWCHEQMGDYKVLD